MNLKIPVASVVTSVAAATSSTQSVILKFSSTVAHLVPFALPSLNPAFVPSSAFDLKGINF